MEVLLEFKMYSEPLRRLGRDAGLGATLRFSRRRKSRMRSAQFSSGGAQAAAPSCRAGSGIAAKPRRKFHGWRRPVFPHRSRARHGKRQRRYDPGLWCKDQPADFAMQLCPTRCIRVLASRPVTSVQAIERAAALAWVGTSPHSGFHGTTASIRMRKSPRSAANSAPRLACKRRSPV